MLNNQMVSQNFKKTWAQNSCFNEITVHSATSRRVMIFVPYHHDIPWPDYPEHSSIKSLAKSTLCGIIMDNRITTYLAEL